MTNSQVEPAAICYQARHDALSASYQRAVRRSKILHNLVTVLLVSAVIAVIQFFNGARALSTVLILVTLLVVAAFFSMGSARARDQVLRRLLHYDRALERLAGLISEVSGTGEEFRTAGHLYEHDLGILGHGSLFSVLETVRTGVGQRGLAKLLLGECDLKRDALLNRREAVQELAPRNELRESIALLGDSRFQHVSAAYVDRWLDAPPPEFHPAVRISLFATTASVLALLVLATASIVPWSAVFLPLAVQGVIAWSVRQRVLPLLEKSSLANQMRLVREGLELFQRQDFASIQLKELRAISFSPEGAVASLGDLHKQLTVVEQRTKEWFLIPSLVFCAGTHAALSIARWKQRNASAMKQWMAAWAEFEALNAVATFAYEHPQYIYPETLADGTGVFEAVGLAHPLLPAAAVANDITLNDETRLYLISGSNMAGKSTLMRSIGVNVVLANAGAPIRASLARMSPLILGASIALTDSLAEGRSKFLAEVERLQAILHIVREDNPQQRVLFLIDEIFSGTNSLDRKVAAEAVVRTLVQHGAIGALSTHDLTLTEMADLPALHAINVHMASPAPNDPLAFDYLLKPGVTKTSNALAIVRMMGIPIE